MVTSRMAAALGGAKGVDKDVRPKLNKAPAASKAATDQRRISSEDYSRYPSGYHGDISDFGNEPDSDAEGIHFKYKTKEGITVHLYAANIVNLDTDVIVNDANDSLQHIGGVALAISNAAGPKFQDVCSNFIAKYGLMYVSVLL